MHSDKFYERYHSGTKFQKRVINKYDFTYRNIINILDKYVEPKSKILDIGCGTGAIDFYLAKQKNHIMGVDISNTAIKYAKINSERFGFSNYIDFKVRKFPHFTEKGLFDVVLCFEI